MFLVALLGAWPALATPAVTTQSRVESYEIEATFQPEDAFLEATARMKFGAPRPSGPTVFYLHGELDVGEVRVGSREIAFEQQRVFYDYDYSLVATRVEVNATVEDAAETMEVSYSGYFHPSRARSPSDYMRIDRDGVFLRSYGYSLWFPVFLESGVDDYPVDFSRVALRTPAEIRAVFVGKRTREVVDDGWRLTEWTARGVDLFAAQCTARPFLVESGDGVVIYHLNDELSAQAAKRIAAFSARLVTIYRQRYRREVAADVVHVVQMPAYGDISSGNLVGLSEGAWRGFEEDASPRRVLAHELVHPYVTFRTPSSDPLYAMATEGFPAYFHLPVLGEILGADSYERRMEHVEIGYRERRRTGTDRRGGKLPPEKPLVEITPDEIGVYKDLFVLGDRALLFVDFLRRRMGERRFREFAGELFGSQTLTYDEFRRITRRFLPESDTDVALWLETTEYPDRFRRSYQNPLTAGD